MKRHESKYNPAVKELSEYLYDNAQNIYILPTALAKITRVLDGVERMDEMISQKDTELQSTKNILTQKEQLILQKDKNLETLQQFQI